MFTGLVEEVGTVARVEHGSGSEVLEVACDHVLADANVGDSISVSGCCLTVTRFIDAGFAADVMAETLARTALGALGVGDPVNLERPVRADGRLGGHLVQGHVDGVAVVEAVESREGWTRLVVALPATLAAYVVEKGSITVEGVSLTVAEVADDWFAVGLIPHTLAVTTLGRRRVGDPVNLEADVVAKYVARLLASGAPSPYVTNESDAAHAGDRRDPR